METDERRYSVAVIGKSFPVFKKKGRFTAGPGKRGHPRENVPAVTNDAGYRARPEYPRRSRRIGMLFVPPIVKSGPEAKAFPGKKDRMHKVLSENIDIVAGVISLSILFAAFALGYAITF